ncbi:MAG TPA: hypothetical protein PK313_15320, partial [Myxococcota bacterium]|nr:hypothetical protein [Myxococcota bacterium]
VASEWDRDPAWTAPTHAGVTVRVDGIALAGQACGGVLAWGRPWTGGLGAAAAWPIDAVDDGGVRFVAPAFARDLVMRVTCAGGPLPESGEASTADMAIPEGVDAAGEPSAPADVPVAPEPGPETPDLPAPADASPDAAIADPPVRRHAGGCSARF